MLRRLLDAAAHLVLGGDVDAHRDRAVEFAGHRLRLLLVTVDHRHPAALRRELAPDGSAEPDAPPVTSRIFPSNRIVYLFLRLDAASMAQAVAPAARSATFWHASTKTPSRA